jgi:hypothetical protein
MNKAVTDVEADYFKLLYRQSPEGAEENYDKVH